MRITLELENDEGQALVYTTVTTIQPSHELRQQILRFLRELSEADEAIRAEQQRKAANVEQTVRKLDQLKQERGG